MPTLPKTARLARVTKRFPGPTMVSTARTDSVPYASAAIAWAPPITATSATPSSCAAASTAGWARPSGPGGVATITESTPATWAGMTFISTVLG